MRGTAEGSWNVVHAILIYFLSEIQKHEVVIYHFILWQTCRLGHAAFAEYASLPAFFTLTWYIGHQQGPSVYLFMFLFLFCKGKVILFLFSRNTVLPQSMAHNKKTNTTRNNQR